MLKCSFKKEQLQMKYSNFLKWAIDHCDVQSEHSNIKSSMQENQNHNKEQVLVLILPYSKCEKLIEPMKNSLKRVLTENVITRVTYLRTKLSSKFTNLKGKTVKEHHNDKVYYVKCPENHSSEDYIGKAAGKLSEIVLMTIMVEMLNLIW